MHMRTLIVMSIAIALNAVARASDMIPAKPQAAAILLGGGDVYTVSGDVIRGGSVLVENGKITAVGSNVSGSASAQRIDCSGKRIYPGLIHGNTELGLVEIDAVRATVDQSETGAINPNARAEVAVNPDSELIPVARSNGVLLALTVPAGGTLCGSSAIIQLDGWTWEDMTLRAPIAIHLKWPDMAPTRGWWQRDSEKDQLKKRDEALAQVRKTFDDARAYANARKAHGPAVGTPDFDARWEAMIPLLDQKIPLIVHANELQQIEAAVAFTAKEKVKLIILGGYDTPRCIDLLKKYDVPVILDGTQRLPERRGDGYDEAFAVPAKLKEAGVRFCIAADRGASLARNLPYHAATAVAFGLSADDALKSITLWPAQILGVADRVGSIEPGKDATLIVTNGDVLEEPTHVERAFIQGREIDLSNKQTRLWDKYREKYRRQGLTK